MRLRLGISIFGATALALGSCAEATAVRVHVYTDVAWESGRRMIITASSEQQAPSLSEPLAEVTGPWSSTDLGDFVLLPRRDRSAPIRLAVVMGVTKDARACSVEAPDGCIFTRRRLGFVEHRTLTVPVNVYAACIGVPCTADTTCNALGECVAADLDPNACASAEGCSLPGETPPTELGSVAGADADEVGTSDAGSRDAGPGDAGPGDAGPGDADAGDAGGAEAFATTDLALGTSHTCRRFLSGRVKCWGANEDGQLGLGDIVNRGEQPGQMGGALPAIALGTSRSARALAAGSGHTCALLDNGQVKCWGGNSAGQLGLGDTVRRGGQPGQMGDALPAIELGTSRSARALAAGSQHTCALLDNGQIKCWGGNSGGQLGLGDAVSRGDKPGQMGDALPAVELGTGRSARALAAGTQYTCALLDNGQVKCWGNNFFGALGLGDTTNRGDKPGQMGDALPAIELGSGRFARALATGYQHTCALLDDAQVKCWGSNFSGQLGLGDTTNRGDKPAQMGDALPAVELGTGRSARALALGETRSCALLDDDRIKCWGENKGMLGLGDAVDRGDQPGELGDALPFVDLGAGRSVRSFAAGMVHTCALLDDDKVKCWGFNSRGQLGLGDTTTRGDQPGQMGDGLPFVDVDEIP